MAQGLRGRSGTVIVMTSNIGSHLIQAMVGRDSDDIKEAVWGELKNHSAGF